MKDQKLANPSPVGFIGFGLAVILLNLHNAGLLPFSTATVAMSFLCGGFAQLAAGFLEYKRGNTFAMTAFLGYGFFWLTMATSWYIPVTDGTVAASGVSAGVYYGLWCLFTLVLFIATLKLNRVLQIIFATMTLLFLFLALGNIAESSFFFAIAGTMGVVCGVTSFYIAMADILNEVYEKTIFPLGVK